MLLALSVRAKLEESFGGDRKIDKCRMFYRATGYSATAIARTLHTTEFANGIMRFYLEV